MIAETMGIITLATIFGVCGGYISRMCGGAPPKLPLGLDAWLYALPILFVSLYIGAPMYAALIAYLLGVLGKRLGHGQYMDLGNVSKIIKPEKIDFIVRKLFGRDINETQAVPGNYKRDWVGLGFTGLVPVIGLSLCVAVYGGSIIGALLLALSGFMKAGAYSLGWFLLPPGSVVPEKLHKEINEATEIGEFFTGFLFYATIVLVLFII